MKPLGKDYNLPFIFNIGIIGALAGLLFGLDIGVISGALKFITLEFNLSTVQESIVVSALVAGATIGSVMSSSLSFHLGRRRTLLISAVIFALGTLLCSIAPNYKWLIAMRILVGVAVGISSFTAPIYLAEVSPRELRGRILALYHFMITVGVLSAFISDAYFSYSGNWRGMLSILFIPAGMMFISSLNLPPSPRWLMLQGKKAQALAVLHSLVRNKAKITQALDDLTANLKNRPQKAWTTLQLPYFRRALVLGMSLQFIQVMSGIYAMVYYGPRIFELVGFGVAGQMWSTVLIGSLNMLANIPSLFLMDRIGRRPLLSAGLSLMILGMATLGLSFYLGPISTVEKGMAVAGMLTFVFGFAISLGPIVWTMCAEIFPLRSRELGVMFTTATSWICGALFSRFFLVTLEHIGAAFTFWLLSLFCLFSLIFIRYFVPETKGISLEKIENNLVNGSKLRTLGQP